MVFARVNALSYWKINSGSKRLRNIKFILVSLSGFLNKCFSIRKFSWKTRTRHLQKVIDGFFLRSVRSTRRTCFVVYQVKNYVVEEDVLRMFSKVSWIEGTRKKLYWSKICEITNNDSEIFCKKSLHSNTSFEFFWGTALSFYSTFSLPPLFATTLVTWIAYRRKTELSFNLFCNLGERLLLQKVEAKDQRKHS